MSSLSDGCDAVLQQAVETGVPGVVAMAATDKGVFYEGAFGTRDLAKGPPMTLDTVFRVASMTKLATSVAALHAALGESAPALYALERAFAVRDTRLVYLKDDVRWAGLRQEPRFVAMLARMRLDRYGPGAPAP